ncbi:MAG: rhomboid family intramembrane serine protease [Dehalococcoidia bacterium]
MIPIRDSQWRASTPYVTRALIILNVLVFLAMLTMDDTPRTAVVIADGDALAQEQAGDSRIYPSSQRSDFTLRFGAVPEFITGYLNGNNQSHDLVEDLRLDNRLQPLPDRGGINLLDGFLLLLTPLTAMFIHGGWFHIIGNMLFLWVFGDNVEDRLGRWRFLLFYVVTGYLAVAAHIWVDSSDLVPMIGASGAIAGVLGAYLVLFPRAKVQVLIPIIFLIPAVIPAPLMIGFWFLTNLFNGVGSVVTQSTGSGGTAWFAHIGGFAAGLLLIYPFLIGRWRAPVGAIAPSWNRPPGFFRNPFHRSGPPDPAAPLGSAPQEPPPLSSATKRSRIASLLRWPARPTLRRRRGRGGVDAYRRRPGSDRRRDESGR